MQAPTKQPLLVLSKEELKLSSVKHQTRQRQQLLDTQPKKDSWEMQLSINKKETLKTLFNFSIVSWDLTKIAWNN